MSNFIIERARTLKAAFLEREMEKRGVYLTRELRPNDVMIVGFPKSGHTWMQSLIVSLKYGIDPRIADDNLIFDLVPDLHQKRWHKRYGASMCFKSHLLPRSDFRRVIYLIRDGRDVMVSYYHYRRAWGYIGSFADLLSEEHEEYGSWKSHIDSWQSNPYGAEILNVNYEKLLSEPEEILKGICDFIGAAATEVQLEAAIERCSFRNMRAKEDKVGRPNKDWPSGAKFMRRGKAGSWEDEMPEDAQKKFYDIAGSTMKSLGYL